MASNQKTREGEDTNFSFGVSELRQANVAQTLSLDAPSPKALGKDLGSDPYNTSGSFDRKKNWTKVGKR
jgi:hypothetical protein